MKQIHLRPLGTFLSILTLGLAMGAATPWKGTEPFSQSSHSLSFYQTPTVVREEAKAKQALEKALATGESGDLIAMRDALVGVVRDYPYTPSAAAAALRVGIFECDLANPEEALPPLLFLVNQHFYSPSGPEGALYLARALAEYGDLQMAKTVLDRVSKEAAKKRIPSEYVAKAKEVLEEAKRIATH